MRILIIGAGAIGCWLGAYLVHAHHDVTFVGRRGIMDALAENGLLVTQVNGIQWGVTGYRCTTTVDEAAVLAEASGERYDVVIFSVKAYSLASAVHDVALVWERITRSESDARQQTLLACFQNGVGCEEVIADTFGSARVISATTTSPVSMASPGMVCEERDGGCVCVAPLQQACATNPKQKVYGAGSVQNGQTVNQFISYFMNTGLEMRRYEDHRSLKWSKMLLNMLGNATGAILDLPAPVLYRDTRVFNLEMKMLNETRQVMQHLGISPLNLPHFPSGLLSMAAAWFPRWLLRRVLEPRLVSGRGEKRPSFYYDIANKTGLCEVSWLNGAVARHGAQLGIRTPVNARLTEVLTDLVLGKLEPDDWRGNVTKLVEGL